MAADSRPLIVIDTQVVVSSLVGSDGSPSSRVLKGAETGAYRLTISDRAISELSWVAGYPAVESRTTRPAKALRAGLGIGLMGEMYYPTRHYWPSIPDPKDWFLPDLAFECGADCIVSSDSHLDNAGSLGFRVVTPRQPARDVAL